MHDTYSLAFFVSWGIFLLALAFQLYYFCNNAKKLQQLKSFFSKKSDFIIIGKEEDSQIFADVAEEGSSFRELIDELNEYTKKNHGTTDFAVIQNKTERKINLLYENATSRIAFPTYIGLMGTFVGVFIGLLFFSNGLDSSVNGEGITDGAIKNLISGVLVSMGTSFIGLLLTTITHHIAANVQKVISEDKNSFYEFLQNELMPTLGVSMVSALDKLHRTINTFEPSFNRVIRRFQTTFDSCTSSFGEAFSKNVKTVADAVNAMGENMTMINDNVDLQTQLLKTLKSKNVVDSLNAFVGAAYSFNSVTKSIETFSGIQGEVKNATLQLIETQENYNKSLEVPMHVANKLNMILDRFTKFENSVNSLGGDLKSIDVFANENINALKQITYAIKNKQELAVESIDTATEGLRNIYELQIESFKKLGDNYERNFNEYAEKFELNLNELSRNILSRKKEFTDALEEKFSLEQLQKEFSQLEKLEKIESLLSDINSKNNSNEYTNSMESIHREISSIHNLINKIATEIPTSQPEEYNPERATFWSNIFGRHK